MVEPARDERAVDGGTLVVATVNLLGYQARFEERWPLLVAGIAREAPDLLALQEVSAAHEVGPRVQRALNEAAVQAGQASAYEYVEQPNTRNWELSVGVLSRLPIVDRQWTELTGQGRVALAASVEVGARRLGFVSTHLFWAIGPGGDCSRLRQAAEL